METIYKNCQSCGMPFGRDSKGGGTNKDGSRSRMYCSHCFIDGQFTLPNITAAQMQQRVRQKMKQMWIPGFVSGVFTRKIPNLARWKSGAAS